MGSSLLGDCQFGHNDLGEHQVNKIGVAMKNTDFSNLLIKSQFIDTRLMSRNYIRADHLACSLQVSEHRSHTFACSEQKKC